MSRSAIALPLLKETFTIAQLPKVAELKRDSMLKHIFSVSGIKQIIFQCELCITDFDIILPAMFSHPTLMTISFIQDVPAEIIKQFAENLRKVNSGIEIHMNTTGSQLLTKALAVNSPQKNMSKSLLSGVGFPPLPPPAIKQPSFPQNYTVKIWPLNPGGQKSSQIPHLSTKTPLFATAKK
ncbi:hypothetical protein AYO45_02945 [Gammaproteobacteria bacterium SCGC AG-212-F23]|nr:hypothetical protein AYO45_02945 [Gammaproteobacteria bacterium SCGC AG-212-F23]